MSANAARDFTEAEIAERAAFLKRLGLSPKGGATVIPLEHEVRKHRPLGLAPAPGPDDAAERDGYADNVDADGRVIMENGYRFSFKDGMEPAILEAPATGDFVLEMANAVTSIADTAHRKAKAGIAELRREARSEISELRAALIEARHEIRELKLIQESMRIANRGERGVDGARGVPGRDGQQGRIGPAGPRGEAGKAAPKIVSWATDDAAFAATPILSDGGNGATLHLRGMFESYHAQVEGEDIAAEADAVRAQRDAVDREVENVRQGRPAR
jgi:hypothetical protein